MSGERDESNDSTSQLDIAEDNNPAEETGLSEVSRDQTYDLSKQQHSILSLKEQEQKSEASLLSNSSQFQRRSSQVFDSQTANENNEVNQISSLDNVELSNSQQSNVISSGNVSDSPLVTNSSRTLIESVTQSTILNQLAQTILEPILPKNSNEPKKSESVNSVHSSSSRVSNQNQVNPSSSNQRVELAKPQSVTALSNSNSKLSLASKQEQVGSSSTIERVELSKPHSITAVSNSGSKVSLASDQDRIVSSSSNQRIEITRSQSVSAVSNSGSKVSLTSNQDRIEPSSSNQRIKITQSRSVTVASNIDSKPSLLSSNPNKATPSNSKESVGIMDPRSENSMRSGISRSSLRSFRQAQAAPSYSNESIGVLDSRPPVNPVRSGISRSSLRSFNQDQVASSYSNESIGVMGSRPASPARSSISRASLRSFGQGQVTTSYSNDSFEALESRSVNSLKSAVSRSSLRSLRQDDVVPSYSNESIRNTESIAANSVTRRDSRASFRSQRPPASSYSNESIGLTEAESDNFVRSSDSRNVLEPEVQNSITGSEPSSQLSYEAYRSSPRNSDYESRDYRDGNVPSRATLQSENSETWTDGRSTPPRTIVQSDDYTSDYNGRIQSDSTFPQTTQYSNYDSRSAASLSDFNSGLRSQDQLASNSDRGPLTQSEENLRYENVYTSTSQLVPDELSLDEALALQWQWNNTFDRAKEKEDYEKKRNDNEQSNRESEPSKRVLEKEPPEPPQQPLTEKPSFILRAQDSLHVLMQRFSQGIAPRIVNFSETLMDGWNQMQSGSWTVLVLAILALMLIAHVSPSAKQCSGNDCDTSTPTELPQGCLSMHAKLYQSEAGSYKYEISVNSYEWNEAKEYCVSRGGDLAYHQMQNLTMRKDITSAFNMRGSHPSPFAHFYFHFGLVKEDRVWRYVDGSVPRRGDVHWDPYEPGADDEFAGFLSQDGHPFDVMTRGCPSKGCVGYALCEYECPQK